MARRIYLDLCVLKRSFDDQTQPRIWLETNAIGLILQAVEAGDLELVHSEVLDMENEQNTSASRRNAAAKWLNTASVVLEVTDGIAKRAGALERLGVDGLDALHLACAEEVGAEAFVTCDDRVRRRYSGNLSVLSPTEFAQELQEGPIGDQGAK